MKKYSFQLIALFILTAGLLVLFYCTKMERTNPVDPGAGAFTGQVAVDADGDGLSSYDDPNEASNQPKVKFSKDSVIAGIRDTVRFKMTCSDTATKGQLGKVEKIYFDWGTGAFTDSLPDSLCTHNFSAVGSVVVRAKGRDNEGVFGPVVVCSVAVHLYAPIVEAGNNICVDSANSQITFKALVSDTGKSVLKYEWDLDGNGTSYSWATMYRAESTFVYPLVEKWIFFRVTDDDSNVVIDSFFVTKNKPPVFATKSSDMNTVAVAGAQYCDTILAIDPENDSITYSIESTKTGFSVTRTGIITWTPAITDTGSTVKVTAKAMDKWSSYDTLLWSITVRKFGFVKAASQMEDSVAVGIAYRDTVKASGAGTRIRYKLLAGPYDFTVDSIQGSTLWPNPGFFRDTIGGTIVWSPGSRVPIMVKIVAYNELGNSDTLAWQIVAFTSGGTGTGLVAYYPFAGNANDSSGNSNHGTVSGATLATDRFGNANSAYTFDGTNDIISATVGAGFAVSQVSISVWINPTGGGSYAYPRVVSINPSGSKTPYYSLMMGYYSSDPRYVRFYGSDQTGAWSGVESFNTSFR